MSQATLLQTMHAFVRTSASTMEVVQQNMPVPDAGPDEILIRVEAFGVGIHDRYFIPQDARFPYVVGSEGAGIIAQTGAAVTRFNSGDKVLFTNFMQPQGGSWATYAVAKESSVLPMPEGLSFAQAAAIPIAGKTALECIRELNLQPGDKIFIAGASGAIGTLVIQMAKARGAHIAASASQRNQEYLLSLGAENAVDYRDPSWQTAVRDWAGGGVDVALAIQPGTGLDSVRVVRDRGRLITVSGDYAQVPAERGIAICQMGHHSDTQLKVAELARDIAAGNIQLVIEQEFPFSEALRALEKTETRHARGKVVVSGVQH